MHAITYRAFGPAKEVLRLEERTPSALGSGEVRVALSHSGVNPSDVKARAGARAGVTELPYPVITPHSDGAGQITEVGPNVPETRVGERVWIWNGQWRRAFGTCATEITLPADQTVPLPEAASLADGASLGIPGLTAAHTVFNAGSVAGKTVLVQGAGGSVGYLAAQLALWGGARVIATARGADLDRAANLGLEAVIDFTRPDCAEAILAANDGAPVDRIVEVEFGLNAATDTAVIAENGTICAYGSAKVMEPPLPFYPLMFKAVTLEMALIYILTDPQRARAIGQLHAALGDGALHLPVAQVFPLAEAAAAHEAVERGARAGAVLIDTHLS